MNHPVIADINNRHGVAPDASTVRIERLLPGPIERVWAYLTESEKRGQWLATGDMDLRQGGKVELHFHHADLSPEAGPVSERYRGMEGGHDSNGRVITCEPPHLLRMTWAEETGRPSEVTFELQREDDAVRLIVTHRHLPDRAQMLSVAGGWHAHLGILIDRLNGRTPQNFWKVHELLEAEYEQLLMPG